MRPPADGVGPVRRHRPRSERGITMVWTGLLLVVMLGIGGAAVDVAHWYVWAERAQSAADAAAQAGVIFLPDQPDRATSTARTIARQNGFVDGRDGATVSVNRDGNPNRLRVEVRRPVRSRFLQLLGLESVTIRRPALAEFTAASSLGSPLNRLGRDPDASSSIYPDPNFWLQMAGPGGVKVNADRYAQRNCDTGSLVVFQCTPNQTLPNNEYDPDGYIFTVDVRQPNGQPLHIEIFDPSLVHEAGCGSNDYHAPARPTDAELTILSARWPDARRRFTTSQGPMYCAGDQVLRADPSDYYDSYVQGKDHTLELVAVIREPDDTPWTDTDNPIVGTANCRPTRFPSFRVRNNGEQFYGTAPHIPTLFQRLTDSNHRNPYTGNLAHLNPDGIRFDRVYHQWYRFCTINTPRQGEYIVQLLTGARVRQVGGRWVVEHDFPNRTFEGQNRFALRAGLGDPTLRPDLTGTTVAARSRLPIYARISGTTTFYLTKVPPNAAGKTMYVDFWDIGDGANDDATLRILPPDDANIATFTSCTGKRDNGTALSSTGVEMDANQCILRRASAYSGGTRNYDGRVAQIAVPIPENYTCNPDTLYGCWVRAQVYYPAPGGSDGTTWSVSLDGDPVRLIE